MAGEWGTREELLHPRDSHGRFRKSWKMAGAVIDRITTALANFNYKTFNTDQDAASYVESIGRKKPFAAAGVDRYLRNYKKINADLRAGKADSPDVKAMDAAMQPLPDDLILNRTVTPEAFGLNAANIAQIEEYTGKLVADRGFSSANIGTPMGSQGPSITMVIAAPRGTRAAIPGKGGSREVILDRDQPLRITKVKPDGRGGYYVMAVATTKGAVGEKRTRKLGGRKVPVTPASESDVVTPAPLVTPPGQGAPQAPGAPAAPQAPAAPVQQAPVRTGRPGRPAAPPPPPRQEPLASEAIGTSGAKRAPTPAPEAPEAAPEAPKPTPEAPVVPEAAPEPQKAPEAPAAPEAPVAPDADRQEAKDKLAEQQQHENDRRAHANVAADLAQMEAIRKELKDENFNGPVVADHVDAVANLYLDRVHPDQVGLVRNELKKVADAYREGKPALAKRRMTEFFAEMNLEFPAEAGKVVDYNPNEYDLPGGVDLKPGDKIKVVRPAVRYFPEGLRARRRGGDRESVVLEKGRAQVVPAAKTPAAKKAAAGKLDVDKILADPNVSEDIKEILRDVQRGEAPAAPVKKAAPVQALSPGQRQRFRDLRAQRAERRAQAPKKQPKALPTTAQRNRNPIEGQREGVAQIGVKKAAPAAAPEAPKAALKVSKPTWGTVKTAGAKDGDIVMFYGMDRRKIGAGRRARLRSDGRNGYTFIDAETGERLGSGGVAAKWWIGPDTQGAPAKAAPKAATPKPATPKPKTPTPPPAKAVGRAPAKVMGKAAIPAKQTPTAPPKKVTPSAARSQDWDKLNLEQVMDIADAEGARFRAADTKAQIVKKILVNRKQKLKAAGVPVSTSSPPPRKSPPKPPAPKPVTPLPVRKVAPRIRTKGAKRADISNMEEVLLARLVRIAKDPSDSTDNLIRRARKAIEQEHLRVPELRVLAKRYGVKIEAGADKPKIIHQIAEHRVRLVKFAKKANLPVPGDPGDLDLMDMNALRRLAVKEKITVPPWLPANANEIRRHIKDVLQARKKPILDGMAAQQPAADGKDVIIFPASAKQWQLDVSKIQDLVKAAESPNKKERHLAGGAIGDTRLVETPDGKKLVHKRDNRHTTNAEQSAATLARLMGMAAPGVYRNDSDSLFMEFVQGRVADEELRAIERGRGQGAWAKFKSESEVFDLPDMKRMALLDALIRNTDRHRGNWMLSDDGRIVPIDHGFSMEQGGEEPLPENALRSEIRKMAYVRQRMSNHYRDRRMRAILFDDHGDVKDNPFTQDDMKRMALHIESMRPLLTQLKVPWFADNMLARLSLLAPHAKGTKDLIPA